MRTAVIIIFCISLLSCTGTPQISKLDEDTYIYTSSPALEESEANGIAVEKVFEYCASLGGEVEIIDVQRKLTSNRNVIEVTFRCTDIKIQPDYTTKPQRRNPADRAPVWPGK